jgi:hypothetical protein
MPKLLTRSMVIQMTKMTRSINTKKNSMSINSARSIHF